MNGSSDRHIVSKQRVADHGEVYTRQQEVNAMLDLVKPETERIESRFLEPACGTGNFLAEILERKLRVVQKRYGKSQLEYERNAVLALSSIYGIDILEDNVRQCRQRLLVLFDENYRSLFATKTKDSCRRSVRFILECNIIHGDALKLTRAGDNSGPIIFSEWSPVNGSMFKRRDFSFAKLINDCHETHQMSLLNEPEQLGLFSDLGEDVFIPTPEKEYPLTHVLQLGETADERQ